MIFHGWKSKERFSTFYEQNRWKGSCLTSKGLAKHLPRIQKLYQITYIYYVFCFHSTLLYQLIGTNKNPRVGVNLQSPIIIQTICLHCCLPWNYVTSLLVYSRGKLRINRCIYLIKVSLIYF